VVPDCFEKWRGGGAKNSADSPKIFAESISSDFPAETEPNTSTFCKILLTDSVFFYFLPEFSVRFPKIWQKVLENFPESRRCFSFLGRDPCTDGISLNFHDPC
jgi:hypothetical protein